MNIKHVTAEALKANNPTAACCDCPREVDQAPDEEIWTIWNNTRFYCPECAKNECIGLND